MYLNSNPLLKDLTRNIYIFLEDTRDISKHIAIIS